jgi:hypothetical protein
MTQERNSKSNCVVCGIRPKQGLLRVCGRTCAEKLKSMRSSGGPTPQDASGTHFPSRDSRSNCVVCGIRPKQGLLRTCGLTCAEKLKSMRPSSRPTPQDASGTRSPQHHFPSDGSGSSSAAHIDNGAPTIQSPPIQGIQNFTGNTFNDICGDQYNIYHTNVVLESTSTDPTAGVKQT